MSIALQFFILGLAAGIVLDVLIARLNRRRLQQHIAEIIRQQQAETEAKCPVCLAPIAKDADFCAECEQYV